MSGNAHGGEGRRGTPEIHRRQISKLLGNGLDMGVEQREESKMTFRFLA